MKKSSADKTGTAKARKGKIIIPSFLALAAVAAVVMMMFASSAPAETEAAEEQQALGAVGDVFYDGGLFYKITEDGPTNYTVEVTDDQGTWEYDYLSPSFTIPSSVTYMSQTYTVTSIGYRAFYGSFYIPTTAVIPNTVKSIGNDAFYYSYLESVTIPDSVETIGDNAFRSAELTSVTVPDSVTSIGTYAFYGNFSLTTATLSDSISIIPDSLFNGCIVLANVDMPSSITSIGASAFYDCRPLTSLTIPDSVTFIGKAAFAKTGLTPAILPTSITYIPEHGFAECTFTSLVIPDHITEIRSEAFLSCYTNMTSVFIPDSVQTIGYRAFDNCNKLTSVTIPSSVTSIGQWAFRGCVGLTSVTIPSSVTSIGSLAFGDCDLLGALAIPYDLAPGSGIVSSWTVRVLYEDAESVTAVASITARTIAPVGTPINLMIAVGPGEVFTAIKVGTTHGANNVASAGAGTSWSFNKEATSPAYFLALEMFEPVTNITNVPDTILLGIDLPLTGIVVPGNATNQTIVWSLMSAGTTGATVSAGVLSVTGPGTLKVTATITNGLTPSTDYTQDFTIEVFVPVTDITNVPDTVVVGTDLPLTGTVDPIDATNYDIVWSVVSDNGTGATISASGVLSVTSAGTGTVTIRATILNGLTPSSDYTQDFILDVFAPVTDIVDVPNSMTLGTDLLLTGTVVPGDATNKDIVWSISSAGTTGATIDASGNLSATSAGTVTVTATIVDGLGVGMDFTKDFTVTVTEPAPKPKTGGDVGGDGKKDNELLFRWIPIALIVLSPLLLLLWMRRTRLFGVFTYDGSVLMDSEITYEIEGKTQKIRTDGNGRYIIFVSKGSEVVITSVMKEGHAVVEELPLTVKIEKRETELNFTARKK